MEGPATETNKPPVMENVHSERSAGWSIFCFVALIAIATFITSPLPSPNLRATDIGLILEIHRTALLIGAWLTFPAAGFFLWFIVGVRSYLSHAPGRQEGLSMLALVSGVIMIALSILAACIESAVAYAPADVFQAFGLIGLYQLFAFLQTGIAFGPISIFCFAIAFSMRRHESAPEWLAWLGYVAAVGCAFGSLSIFFRDGFMSPTGSGPQDFGLLPAGAFLVCIGLELIKRRPDAVTGTALPTQ
jgi:hypothetical protein